MRTVKVKELLAFSSTHPAVVPVHTDLRAMATKMLEDQRTREVYVADERGRFLGVVTLRRLARYVFSSELPGQISPTELLELVSARTAGDLALRKPAYVHDDDTFERLMEVMFQYDINEIPVVSGDKLIVGTINLLEVISAQLEGKLDRLRTG